MATRSADNMREYTWCTLSSIEDIQVKVYGAIRRGDAEEAGRLASELTTYANRVLDSYHMISQYLWRCPVDGQYLSPTEVKCLREKGFAPGVGLARLEVIGTYAPIFAS